MGCQQSVSSFRLGGNETQNRSEGVRIGVDMGQLVIGLKPPNGPPDPLSGNPNLAKEHPEYPQVGAPGCIVTGDFSCPRSSKPTP
jgi:hypothetical protein